MSLSKTEALAFLNQAKQFQDTIGSFLSLWRPWKTNPYQSGIDYQAVNPFVFGSIGDTKNLDDLIEEIVNAAEFNANSDEAQWIKNLLKRKEMVLDGRKSSFVSSLDNQLNRIEEFFAGQDANSLPQFKLGKNNTELMRIVFFISPHFFNQNDEATTEERRQIIQESLLQEFEKRLCLDVFFNNNGQYVPKEECFSILSRKLEKQTEKRAFWINDASKR